MIVSNEVRRKAIYELWYMGLTIDEITSKTGMPRSSVGYYVKKFRKKQILVDLEVPKRNVTSNNVEDSSPNRTVQNINAAIAYVTYQRMLQYSINEDYDKVIKAFEAYKTLRKALADISLEFKKCKPEFEDVLAITGYEELLKTGKFPKAFIEAIESSVASKALKGK